MATGRMLRGQISVSPQVNDLSLKATLLFTWLIPHVDDFGRINANSRRLKSIIFPMRDDIAISDIDESLYQMSDQGLIILYEVESEIFLQMTKFDQHQRIDKRTASKLPSPEGAFLLDSGKFREIPGNSRLREEKLREEKLREEEEKKNTLSASPPACISKKQEEIKIVFECWQKIMSHNGAKLSVERRKIISNGLAMGYTPDQLCEAIRGCSMTPFYMGDNDRGETYDGLKVIFKSADQIDKFLRYAKNPPRPINKTEKLFEGNKSVVQSWVERKKQEIKNE